MALPMVMNMPFCEIDDRHVELEIGLCGEADVVAGLTMPASLVYRFSIRR